MNVLTLQIAELSKLLVSLINIRDDASPLKPAELGFFFFLLLCSLAECQAAYFIIHVIIKLKENDVSTCT